MFWQQSVKEEMRLGLAAGIQHTAITREMRRKKDLLYRCRHRSLIILVRSGFDSTRLMKTIHFSLIIPSRLETNELTGKIKSTLAEN